MPINPARRQELIEAHRAHEGDTGSTKVQVVDLTLKINALSEHCAAHKCDKHALLGLVKLLSKRRKMLDYLARVSPEGYAAVLKDLELRK